jgi:4-alpha-glucanotransferase
MNRPGTTDARNWKWRLERPLTDAQADTLAAWTAAAGRDGASAVRAA